jgi:hypothetical protein
MGLDRIKAALAEAEASGGTLVFPADISLSMFTGRVQGHEKIRQRSSS